MHGRGKVERLLRWEIFVSNDASVDYIILELLSFIERDFVELLLIEV